MLGNIILTSFFEINPNLIIKYVVFTVGPYRSKKCGATAIYPSAAMTNHSCVLNIINNFYKCRLIVRCPLAAVKSPTATCRTGRATPRPAAAKCCCPSICSLAPAPRAWIWRGETLFAYACQSCKLPVVRGARRSACPHCQAPFQKQRAAVALDKANGLLPQAERASSMVDRIEKTRAAFKLK